MKSHSAPPHKPAAGEMSKVKTVASGNPNSGKKK